MLQSLRIRNLALLDEVALDFETGFTAVTGETGAGKSILLGALSLLAGARADKTIIRQGAPACEVEAALFFADSRKLDAALAALDLPPCDDGVLILKRSLPRDKAPAYFRQRQHGHARRRCRNWANTGSISTARANRAGCSRRAASANCSISSRRMSGPGEISKTLPTLARAGGRA